MQNRITESFRGALREAATSVSDIAREMGVARVTLDLYLNRRRPSAQMALRLAAWLRSKAQGMVSRAEELERAIDERTRPPRSSRSRPSA